jgi:alginate O-acetyltransferase complex protein AlgI
MLFNSYMFICLFLPIALLGYYALSSLSGMRLAQLWLILCSLFFYGWWDYRFLGLLIPSIVINFVIGRSLVLSGASDDQGRFRLLFLGVTGNLVTIGYFKYAGFLSGIFQFASVADFNLGAIVLPLAISFFTFQQIAFLVDTYRRKTNEVDFQNYVLFVTFFPQLIAGPIVHHREMMPQFKNSDLRGKVSQYLALGLSIFIVGLFKKVVIADGFALFATPVFGLSLTGGSVDFLTAWMGALSYTFQLYFDFSGYSDMAIGLGLMFGVQLPLNFFSPYKARNIVDFWRRWHMTLSRFLRDYLYFPLGGNRKGNTRRYFNLVLTMLLGGLWHGAGWTFIFWGGLHGAYLVINHGWLAIKPSSVRSYSGCSGLRTTLSIGITFIAVTVSWVFFRAETFSSAITIISGMVSVDTIVIPNALQGPLGPVGGFLQAVGVEFGSMGGAKFTQAWLLICLGALVVFFLPNTWEVFSKYLNNIGDEVEWSAKKGLMSFQLYWMPKRKWAMSISVMAFFAVLALTKVSEFLYFRF